VRTERELKLILYSACSVLAIVGGVLVARDQGVHRPSLPSFGSDDPPPRLNVVRRTSAISLELETGAAETTSRSRSRSTRAQKYAKCLGGTRSIERIRLCQKRYRPEWIVWVRCIRKASTAAASQRCSRALDRALARP
jgi:hypothetical protein